MRRAQVQLHQASLVLGVSNRVRDGHGVVAVVVRCTGEAVRDAVYRCRREQVPGPDPVVKVVVVAKNEAS